MFHISSHLGVNKGMLGAQTMAHFKTSSLTPQSLLVGYIESRACFSGLQFRFSVI